MRTQIRTGIACFLGVSAVLLASPSFGQERSTAQPSSDIQEVVVTAERRSEPLQEVPIAVTAVSANQMEQLNVRTAQDLMQAVPSLQVATQTAGNGSGSAVYFIRGVGQERQGNGSEPAVGIYVDDFYYPTLYGSDFNIIDLDQVEVLRGPQGTLFGRNTIGGAIRYTTKNAELNQFDGHVDVTGGSYNRYDAVGAVNIPIGDFAAIRLTGGHLQQDGWVHVQEGGPDAGQTMTNLVRVQVRVEPTSSVYVNVSGQYSRNRLDGFAYNLPGPLTPQPPGPGEQPGLPYLYNTLIAPAFGLPLYDDALKSQCFYCQPGPTEHEFSYTTYKNLFTTVGWTLNNNFSLKSLTGWQSVNTALSIDPDGTPDPIYTYVLPQLTDSFSQEVQFNGNGLLNDKLNFVLGGFYYYEHLPAQWDSGENLLFGQPVPSAVENRTLKSYAGYIDGNYALTSKLKLIGGFRYAEDHKDAQAFLQGQTPELDSASGSFDSSTWRAGLQYQWNPDIMSYLTVSTGYRAGGFNPYSTIPELSFLAFSPEESTSYEAGTRMQFADRRVTVNPTIFYVDWRNIQVQNVQIIDASTGETGTVLQNVAKARSYGFELEGNAQVTDSLRLFGNFAYLNIRYTDIGAATGLTENSELQRAPPITYAVGASYTLALGSAGSMETTLNYAYEDDQQSSPKTSLYLPAYALLNARISFSDYKKRYTLSLFATNLLNKDYYVGGVDYTGLAGSPHYDVGSPRELGATFSWHF
jgi:iron complex outermembrane recepter protein